ncbi:Eco57I restriction-modification methylase domain-containing protein [Streptomyces sp. NPDC060333]|uniref:Eco57I restriction-modification methylase domain-containing protein n=1 Tax=Streptomyces sp. NPDC060333 TaxID=3347098 RepID=UPI00365A7E00
MTFDSLINESEYFPSFYLDEILPKQLERGPLKEWAALERQDQTTPRQSLRDLTRPYIDARAALGPDAEKYNQTLYAPSAAAQEAAAAILKAVGTEQEPPAFHPAAGPSSYEDTPEGEWRAALAAWHGRVLKALGFSPAPGHFTVHTPTGTVAAPVLHQEPGIVVLAGGFADDLDATRGDGHANHLAAPVRLASGKTLTTVRELASWVLGGENAPRYALLLFGAVIILADREAFSRGRYLAVNLDTALPRKAAKGAKANEIDLIAAIFAASSLRPAEDGSDDEITKLVSASRDHSVGVTAELRVGLQKSVHLIANEILNRAREEHGVHPEDFQEWLPTVLKEQGDLPRLLTEESLRYLYRILFLLYAEARPELNILPMRSEEYATGYSVARLRDLVVQEKLSSGTRGGFHFHDSLALLFDKVFTGHPTANTVTSRDAVREELPVLEEDDGHEGIRIEALRSRLFDPQSIRLVGERVDYPFSERADGSAAPAPLDLRLRNKVLHEVLRHLTLVEGRGKGRGGFISYANLSINHLGAVYEGLMSYTGFIAKEALYEVAKGGDSEGGSWLITASQVQSGRYPDGPDDSVFVKDKVDRESGELASRVYPVGSYVYRLAGRDRQTSASYYTPESLTQATVEQTLRFRLDDDGNVDPREPEKGSVSAAEVLRWRVCEPALGSGAFLNEAVNQLAELYLKLAQHERGEDIDPEEYPRELQKVKAYIALHNAYGVDLNKTAVELAEISLWLNTMYPGMRAPWYGLHLHRGNSLIGASRKVYPLRGLSDGRWLKSTDQQAPKVFPLTQKLPKQQVHQFLLPALGWGSVGDSVSVRKATGNSVVAGADAEWLEPERIETLKKWRSKLRRPPQGGSGGGSSSSQTVAEGQVSFDLDLDLPEQPASAPSSGGRGLAAVRREAKREEEAEQSEGRTQTGRLTALAERVEYLWDLVQLRLKLSEQEISRGIPVWGAERDDDSATGPVMDRAAVLEALHVEGSPYWRLKQVMDAWCALWFWPLEQVGLLDGTDAVYFHGEQDLTKIRKGGADRKVALKSLDNWIEFAESVVGRVDVDSGKSASTLYEVPEVEHLKDLDTFEAKLDEQMTAVSGWTRALDLGDLFPWHGLSYRIAQDRGFFHWELDFAHIFAEGGFDLMVGNPPWVKQVWSESGVLAEFEPWFELADKPSNAAWAERKEAVLVRQEARSVFLGELADSAAMSGFLASLDTHPELVGTQPDLYRAFMLLAWRGTGTQGAAGLIHPATHLTGAKEGTLRHEAYKHLRLHADFVNAKLLFAPPVSDTTHFSVNVYGAARAIRFQHISWLFHPLMLSHSIWHDGTGDTPGIKHQGSWDIRPHRERVITVDRATLAGWQKLAGEENPPPVEEAKLLFPVTAAEESAISALARWPHRLGALAPRISRGFDEKNDRTAGYFTWDSGPADSWNDVILQGPFFGIATPFAKRPAEGARTSLQVEPWNPAALSEHEIPHTNYRQAPGCTDTTYRAALARRTWRDLELQRDLKADDRVAMTVATLASDKEEEQALIAAWASRPYSRFTRLVWRRQIASNTERSLFASLFPPGPAHVHMVHSMSLATERETALAAGFWASLPLDYFLRATGRSDLQVGEAQVMPAPTAGHPLAPALLLRTLRLNAQADAYGHLWSKLHDPVWAQDSWVALKGWPVNVARLSEAVESDWNASTPLRSEFARRAALVEIDALVAVWLGISADELVAMYRARFPVLQQYEENMWFDANGRRIAKAHQQHGYGQPKDAWKQLSSHENFPLKATAPDGYEGPLYRANRVKEMRAAHAEFTRRLRAAGWEPGDTEPPVAAGEE